MVIYWSRRFLKAVLRPHVSPHQVALGTAVGVAIAFTPTIGFQMILAAAVATALRASRPAAVLPVWITNPLTIVPIYGFTYLVGWWLVGGPTAPQFLRELRTVLQRVEGYGAWELVDRFTTLLTLGMDAMLPLTVGGLIVGLVCGAASYVAVRLMIRWLPVPRRRRMTENASVADPLPDKSDVRRAA